MWDCGYSCEACGSVELSANEIEDEDCERLDDVKT